MDDMINIRRLAYAVSAFMMAAVAGVCLPAPLFSKMPQKDPGTAPCTYFMCEYEKSNIDTIILEHAKACQTIMFGEIHDNALEGMPPPVQDSIYVVTLLAQLREMGYAYLALEVNQHAPAGTHSNDLVRFYRIYKKGQPIQKSHFFYAKPGWIELVKKAIDLGYNIRFIDAGQRSGFFNLPRDQAMYETLKKEIFDSHHNARVIVYIGAFHIGEQETDTGIFMGPGKKKPLGLLLDQYTKGKNFSVYMGHTKDTPVGCDLSISDFIWNTDPSVMWLPEKP